ncbi:MAG: serine hydrolase domain-containing protein [Pseudomonadota bacterium]
MVKQIAKGMMVALVLFAAWFIAVFAVPLYGFQAHNGDAPFPPWGWERPSGEAPKAGSADLQYTVTGAQVLAAMEAHREKIGAPGMTAAVAIDGRVVWRGAVGWADIAKNEAMTSDHALRIGSTSKALTASALVQMVQDDTIDLDRPITDYLDDTANESWSKITPRMLASHMAGMPHYGDNKDADGLIGSFRLRRNYSDMTSALVQIDQAELLSEPGTTFEYSSLGTVLLGATMEAAADKRYREIVRDEVLVPAGAERTFVAPRKGKADQNLATFYFLDPSNDRFRAWRPVDLSHRLPGGGWASTSVDLVRIGSLWLDDDFVSPELRNAFWEPQRLSDGSVNEQDYAISFRWREWEVDGAPLARNANHGGVSKGAQSWLLIYPDLDMVIAYNMNGRTDTFSPFAAFHDAIYRPFAMRAAELRPDLER